VTIDDRPAPVAIDALLDEARSALPARARPEDLAQVWAEGGLVVDTRPASLRQRDGDLPGAVVVERNVLEWRLDPTSPHRIPEVRDHDQPVVVVCDEGYASSLAAVSLQQLGLRRATDLDGGYQAWRRFQAAATSAAH
jgi:rhodanese-related sulfurtransferase